MKKIFLILLSVLSLCLFAVGAKKKEVLFSFDRPDRIYHTGDTVRITMNVLEKRPETRWLDAVIRGKRIHVKGDTVSYPVTETDGFKTGILLQGILPANKEYDMGSEWFWINPEKLVPALPPPSDFRAYWENQLKKLKALPPGVQKTELKQFSVPGKYKVWKVSFNSLEGRIYGFLTVPEKPGRYPAVMSVCWAGGGWTRPSFTCDDRVTLQMNVHNFDPEKRAEGYEKLCAPYRKQFRCRETYMYIGFPDREKLYYRHGVAGCVRALEWLATLPEVDPARIGYRGTSQGGAFGIWLAALTNRFCAVVSDVPAFCNMNADLQKRSYGFPWYQERVGKSPEVRKVMGYLDTVNFASYVRCPIRVVAGAWDSTCPPANVRTAFNRLGSKDKLFFTDPDRGHGDTGKLFTEQLKWLDAQLKGGPSSPERSRYALITRKTPRWTSPFDVPDKAGYQYGTRTRQSESFLKAAARAAITMDEKNLTVYFRCPVPAGMKIVNHPSDLWKSDHIEFFLRPKKESEVYYQYCAGTNGKTEAYRYTSRLTEDKKFRSRAVFDIRTADPKEYTVKITIPKTEVECAGLKEGNALTGNFCRSGVTAGGNTSWIPVSGDFHAVDSFGTLIAGNFEGNLRSRLARLKETLKQSKGDAALGQAIGERIALLETECGSVGENAERYEKLLVRMESLNPLFVSYTLSGRKSLLRNVDPWASSFPTVSGIRPLTPLRFTAAQNSRVLFGFAFTNLSDKPFTGLLKCFEKWPMQGGRKCFWNEPFNDFLRKITFFEGMEIQDAGGNPLYDPMLPLTMKSLLRAAPGQTVPLWMTISTKGLKPGKYTAVLVLKPVLQGFETETVPVELTVLPIDLKTVKADSFHYAFFTEARVNSPDFTDIGSFYRYLGEREANVMFAGNLTDVQPDTHPDGTLKKINYTLIDRKIDLYLQGGIPREDLKLMFHIDQAVMDWRDKTGKLHGCRHRFGTPVFEKSYRLFLREFASHLKAKYGMNENRILFYTVDEPDGDPADRKSKIWRACYYAGLIRKALPRAGIVCNPYPRQGVNESFLRTLRALRKDHNVVILLHTARTPEVLKLCKELKFEIWGYAVLNKTVSPAAYRRLFYDAFLLGCAAPNAYWSVDSVAGDGFDSRDFKGNGKGGFSRDRMDWGTAYCDMNLGAFVTGRRAEAHYQGLLDYKLMKLADREADRQKDPALWKKRIRTIVEKGKISGCDAMDSAHEQLLKLILQMNEAISKVSEKNGEKRIRFER